MKIKRIITSIIVSILILAGSSVYATLQSTVTLESVDKAKSGDEISVNVKLDVTSSIEGVEAIIGEIEYPTEILTMLTPESSEVTIMDGMLMVALDEPVNEGEKIITIKFIVKNNIEETEATIRVKDIVVTDVDKTIKELETIEKTIKINQEETEEEAEKTLTSIEITKGADKIEYTEGEKFDPTGMVVIAKYSDETSKEIKDYTYAPQGELGKNDTKITISYTEDGVSKTDEIEITVKEKVAQGKEDGKENAGKQDGTESGNGMPYAGVKGFIIPVIVVAIFAVISYVGYRRNNV